MELRFSLKFDPVVIHGNSIIALRRSGYISPFIKDSATCRDRAQHFFSIEKSGRTNSKCVLVTAYANTCGGCAR